MNKGNTPKRKRLNRAKRLKSGEKWLESNNGKNVVKRYRKWFGVDTLCAIIELRILGVEISKEYEEQVKQSIEARAKERKRRKEKKNRENLLEFNSLSDGFSDYTYAYIAGYTSNGVPFGITHEEMEAIIREDEEKQNMD